MGPTNIQWPIFEFLEIPFKILGIVGICSQFRFVGETCEHPMGNLCSAFDQLRNHVFHHSSSILWHRAEKASVKPSQFSNEVVPKLSFVRSSMKLQCRHVNLLREHVFFENAVSPLRSLFPSLKDSCCMKLHSPWCVDSKANRTMDLPCCWENGRRARFVCKSGYF